MFLADKGAGKMLVLFVGDEPSSRNIDPDVAFVGTPSYERLLNWCKYLSITDPYFVNRTSKDFCTLTAAIGRSGHPIVALGEKAHAALKSTGLKHYHMPHPSPRNRLWNNPETEHEYLKQLFEWLQANKSSY
jgi:uracil-DNA glycosylase